MRFVPDPTARVLRDRDGRRRNLLGGSPLRLWTLTDAGAALVDSVLAGDEVDLGSGGVARLLDRLVDAGALHPDPDPDPGPDADLGPYSDPGPESDPGPDSEPGGWHPDPTEGGSTPVGVPTDVTVVIPVRDRAADLDHLLGSLARTTSASPVVVVDDGSSDRAAHAEVARRHGARLVRRESAGGPAVARNDGIAAADTPYVAVLDSDCVPTDGWLGPLLAHLSDPRVAAAAPRIRSAADRSMARVDGAIGTYERFRSPLDLGVVPATVRPGSRVAYVPTAALVLRVDALSGVGAFDPTMQVGEDVDLVWRLVAAGWRVRYEPAAVVEHPPRPGWVPWLRQRISYGSSAALLDRRHPGEVAPLRCSSWSAAGWMLVAGGHPALGGSVLGWSAAMLPRRLRSIPASDALRLAVTGHVGAGRQAARAVVREWWPIATVAAVASPRARRLLGASIVVTAVAAAVDAGRSDPDLPRRDAVLVGSLAVVDDLAYGVGVWKGCLRARSWRALLPRFSGTDLRD